MNNPKKILVCPLNWGLGHATRMIPVIDTLVEKGHIVTIGADGLPLQLLKKKYPNLRYIEIPSFPIKYTKGKGLVIKLIIQSPGFLKSIKKERKLLRDILEKNEYDLIISDNRYGLFTESVKTVFFTHQLMIRLPGFLKLFEGILHRRIIRYVKKFDHCLIPDTEGNHNLSGDLSHKYPLPANAGFVGPLSRFKDLTVEKKDGFDFFVICSGPEPQRTIFEDKITKELIKGNYKAVIIRGLPNEEDKVIYKNITFYSHVSDGDFLDLVAQASCVVSRSGYSTIMDLIKLKKRALLVPTPGQTEQEYLAEHLTNNKQFRFVDQREIKLSDDLIEWGNKDFESIDLSSKLEEKFKEILSD